MIPESEIRELCMRLIRGKIDIFGHWHFQFNELSLVRRTRPYSYNKILVFDQMHLRRLYTK